MVFKLPQFPRSPPQYEVELEMGSVSSQSSMTSTTAILSPPNIFGFYRYLQTFSPLNCGAPRPFCYLTRIFTILVIFSMLFRVYWMFWQTGTETLTFGWAESKMYGVLSFEAFCVTIAVCRITWSGSLERFEMNLGKIQSLRVGGTKLHQRIDDYRILKFRLFIGITILFVSLVLTSIYLVYHKKFIYEEVKHSNWYWIVDPIMAILGAYSNLLFLPNHTLMHHAMAREFDVFNEEMAEFSKERKLANPSAMRMFGDRQVKMFDFVNYMTARLQNFMTWAPFFSLIALLMGTYILSQFDKPAPTLYFICLVAVTVSCFIMSFNLLYPVAFVQESMSRTAQVLMTDPRIQNSDDATVHNSYRMMLDRALFNRTTNNVLHVFAVNRKNVERAFFIHSLVIIAMVIVYDFQTGLEEGFGEIEKFAKMMQAGG